MAVCRKTLFEIITVLVALTLVVATTLLTCIGLGRYFWNLEDDKFNNRNHYILAGNLISVAALAITLYVLLDSGDQGVTGVVLMMSMLFNLVIVLYLSNYDPSDKVSSMTAIVMCLLDTYVKVYAILLGYGTCNTGDFTSGIYGVGKAMVGGRRR